MPPVPSAAIVVPVLVQVSMTFALLMWMARVRVAALRAGEVKLADVALGQDAWPPRVRQIANSFHSQIEMPMLFYAGIAFALILKAVTWPLVALAWAFVAFRLAHVWIHVTDNNVPRRFRMFVGGIAALIGMWGLVGWHVLVQGAG